MCGGAPKAPDPKPAKIKQPKMHAANAAQRMMTQAVMQMQSPDNELLLAQMRMQQSDKDLSRTIEQARDLKLELANNQAALSEKAMQMAALMGPPPPEPVAKPPVVGRDREDTSTRRRGRTALRVDRVTTSGSAPGAGLSIT
jgi:seryl-tRNA synthetase